MNRNNIIRFLLLLLITFFPFEILLSQQKLDHKVFLEKIKNSSNNIYNDCIKEYDTYLEKHPDDVSVLIEKCQFIQSAQYDEDEEYNPNQDEFDSCSADLIKRFPDNPKVLVFQTTYLWYEEQKKVFEDAEKSIDNDPEKWTKEDLALMYKAMSDYYYYESDNKQALKYITKAISNDEKYRSSVDYARILIEMGNKDAALSALIERHDTTEEVWETSQRADLLLKLQAYSDALDLYNEIREKDSAYIDNNDLASTLEGIGKYDLARECLVADTSESWDKDGALRNLLNHDLKYSNGDTCAVIYNRFRDTGFMSDPLGFYRLKLFFAHPLQPWKFRDISGILMLLLLLMILIVVPYIWILPLYFAGRRWKLISNKTPFDSPWNLKMFWLVSVGFLFASLFTAMANPETLYSSVNSSYYNVTLTSQQEGLAALIFIIFMTIFGVAALYKVNLKILLSDYWSIGMSILVGIGVLFIFKIISGIYVKLGVNNFGISIDDLANVKGIILSSQENVKAVIATYGKVASLLLIGIIAPFYEEVIFRGVILSSCQKYLNFNLANTFQAAIFSAVHLNLFLFPVFFLFGFLTGILRKRSGGLLSSFVFHMMNNILVLVVLFIRY